MGFPHWHGIRTQFRVCQSDGLNLQWGQAVARTVEELSYKTGNCGFDSR
jgi:hypothetical protein